jgi:hypothetical protein
MRTICILAGAIVTAAIMASASSPYAQETKLPVPNVTVTAPVAPAEPPYLRDPWKSYQRNPYAGRYRVEEDKFVEVPCNVTRIASAAGGRCLQGYRLVPGQVVLHQSGGLRCDMALDVVIYTAGNFSVEASTLIFDPYKLVATGMPSKWCYIIGYPGYGQEDFQDMNQVTRRGTNWRNLVSNGEDKFIEFSDGPHNCVAVHRPGPKWRGGYVYMLHASICRTDTAAVRTEDIAYALGSLQVRQYDPEGNLRQAGQ